MSRTNEPDDIETIRAKLREYADEMDGYQLRLTVSFIEELFDFKERGGEGA